MEGENFMLEKLKQILLLFVSFYDYLVDKSPEIKAQALSKVENLKENMDQVITPEVRANEVLKGENLMEIIVEKLKEFLGLLQHLMEIIVEKLKEFLGLLQHLNWELVEKLDLVMPDWIRDSDFYQNFKVGFPLALFIISVIVLMVVLNCCYKGLCCCCCGSSRSRRVKMMRAPGRSEYFMPRYEFENNPRSYFLDLRGKGGSTTTGYNYTLLDP